MNLINEIIAEAVKGVNIPFKFSHADGSINGHPHSVSLQSANLELIGGQMLATAELTVAAGFEPVGPHSLRGVMTIPHGPSKVTLDGATVPDGRMILLGHVKGREARAEILFFCPREGDPLFHFRIDGAIARL